MEQALKPSLVDLISETMRVHVGEHDAPIGEGGCPRINWYGLRNELATAVETWNSTPTAIEASPVVGEIEAVVDLIERLEKRTKFNEAVIKIDKIAFYERSDLTLDREAAASLASLQSENQALREERDGARKWAYEQRLAKHRSGCACHISDDEKLVSVCNFHKEFVERAEAAESQVQSLTLKLEERDKLERAIEFVASMCWRTDPPNANAPFTEAERFSAIKHHPTIKRFGAGHIELAEREARSLQSGGAEHA